MGKGAEVIFQRYRSPGAGQPLLKTAQHHHPERNYSQVNDDQDDRSDKEPISYEERAEIAHGQCTGFLKNLVVWGFSSLLYDLGVIPGKLA